MLNEKKIAPEPSPFLTKRIREPMRENIIQPPKCTHFLCDWNPGKRTDSDGRFNQKG